MTESSGQLGSLPPSPSKSLQLGNTGPNTASLASNTLRPTPEVARPGIVKVHASSDVDVDKWFVPVDGKRSRMKCLWEGCNWDGRADRASGHFYQKHSEIRNFVCGGQCGDKEWYVRVIERYTNIQCLIVSRRLQQLQRPVEETSR